MDWGSWVAEVLSGAFLVGWGILARYMATRHPDAFDRLWPAQLKEKARTARNQRSQRIQMTVVLPGFLILAGAAVLIEALISLVRASVTCGPVLCSGRRLDRHRGQQYLDCLVGNHQHRRVNPLASIVHESSSVC